MIYRNMYRGYSKEKKITISPAEGIFNASASYMGDMVFLYFESKIKDICPDFAKGDLIPFPDGRIWERMNDIFHYSTPLSDEHWRRKIKKTPTYFINRLNTEKISEYIFYHFQYQEELPGDGDRYGIIFNTEDIIVMYLEDPTEEENETIPGKLDTANTPRYEKWSALTDPMFVPFPGMKTGWNKIDLLIAPSFPDGI